MVVVEKKGAGDRDVADGGEGGRLGLRGREAATVAPRLLSLKKG